MVIGLNTNYDVSRQVMVGGRRKQQVSFAGEEKKQGSAVGTAAKGAVIGGAIGAGGAALVKSGKFEIPNAVKGTAEKVTSFINEQLAKSDLASALKRTAKKAQAAAADQAEKILTEGTRPLAKGALIGAVVGMLGLLGLRAMSNKKDASAVESLKPIS